MFYPKDCGYSLTTDTRVNEIYVKGSTIIRKLFSFIQQTEKTTTTICYTFYSVVVKERLI